VKAIARAGNANGYPPENPAPVRTAAITWP
jgi:hypothetical protein